jgi:hypothetical protein
VLCGKKISYLLIEIKIYFSLRMLGCKKSKKRVIIFDLFNFKRAFSSAPRMRADPLGTTASAFGTPYASSFLVNPLGASLIILLGMASTLFFLTASLPGFFGLDPSYAHILQ